MRPIKPIYNNTKDDAAYIPLAMAQEDYHGASIDFINGVVIAEGKRVGVETPFCEKVVEIVHGIENGLYEIDYKNVDFFVF